MDPQIIDGVFMSHFDIYKIYKLHQFAYEHFKDINKLMQYANFNTREVNIDGSFETGVQKPNNALFVHLFTYY